MGTKENLMSTPDTSFPATPVRRSVSELIPQLQYLTINAREISTLAVELAEEEFPLPAWRAPVFPNENDTGVTTEDVINFLFLGNTINFQFRDYSTGEKFAAEYAGTEWRGAFGMWACLKREFEENPAILAGETLATLSRSDVERLFASSNDIPIPMIEERVETLNNVGRRLEDQYQGEFANLIKQSKPKLFADGDGIVDHLVSKFPSFRDSALIEMANGEHFEISFWKRAQLAPGMAYGRFHDSMAFKLKDPEAFTVFVDYNLPNVLRGYNILEYSEQLAKLVDNRKMVQAGSRQEVELRAATIHAADRLIEEINTRRETPIFAPHMDYKLFTMRDNISTPVHLTQTTAY